MLLTPHAYIVDTSNPPTLDARSSREMRVPLGMLVGALALSVAARRSRTLAELMLHRLLRLRLADCASLRLDLDPASCNFTFTVDGYM